MRNTPRYFVLVLIAIAAGCDGATRTSGRVVDNDGIPIEGARVALEQIGPWENTSHARTDADGKFSVMVTHPPARVDLRLSISMDGYTRWEREFHSDDSGPPPTITLQQE